jgi:hypothetical protein
VVVEELRARAEAMSLLLEDLFSAADAETD